MAWNSSLPTSATVIVDIPSIFQGNQTEMENILAVEHYTYTSSLSGRHWPGITGFMYIGTTNGITGISNPGTGAIALDTDLGLMKRYSGSAWDQICLFEHPLLDAYQNTNVTLASGSTETLIPFDTETNDPLNAHDTTNGKFTAPANGYYLSIVHLDIQASVPGTSLTGTIYRYNSSDSKLNQQTEYIYKVISTDNEPIIITTFWYLAASDYLIVKGVHNYSGNVTITGGQDNTWWKIYRLN